MQSKRTLLLLAGVLCCTAAVVQKEAETPKEMYEANHPDIDMFGYPAVLRVRILSQHFSQCSLC